MNIFPKLMTLFLLLCVFFSTAFTEMVEYMRVRGEDAKQIDTIQQTFDILISM